MENSSVIELIKKRKSIRTYRDEVLDQQTIEKLQTLIAEVNKVGPFKNRIRYELVILDEFGIKNINKLINYGFIKGCPAFIAGIMEESDSYLVDFGYLMEDLILKTVEIGLDTCWLGGSLNTDAFKNKLKISGKESLPAIFSIGLDAEKTRTFDKVIRSTLHGNKRKAWELLFLDENRKPLKPEETDKYNEALEMIRLAPSACNKQPWRVVKETGSDTYHFYMVRDVAYSKSLKFRKRSDLQKMDMGIAMYHFEESAKELGLKGAWTYQDSRSDSNNKNFEYIVSWIE